MSDNIVSTVAITDEVLNEAVFQAAVDILKGSEDFKVWVNDAVREEVKIQAPGNPRIRLVIKEVQESLDRYPALAYDVGLQKAVGKAIFDYLQGSL